MSEYVTTNSSRGLGERNPSTYGSAKDVVKNPKIPRLYQTGDDSPSIPKGYILYAKSGQFVFFFSDSNGSNRIMKSKGQVNDPVRAGKEFVGIATGKVATSGAESLAEVEWVNSFVNHNLFKADEKVNEPKIGWVKVSQVDWQKVYQSPDERLSDDDYDPDAPDIENKDGGIETITLGIAAISAALIFSKRKRRK